MKKYFLIAIMISMVAGNFSYAAEEEKHPCCSKKVAVAYARVAEAADLVDETFCQDPSCSLLLASAHFLTTLGGTYQILRPYMDDNTAGFAAVAVSAGRMFWAYKHPVSSIPGTSGVLFLVRVFSLFS